MNTHLRSSSVTLLRSSVPCHRLCMSSVEFEVESAGQALEACRTFPRESPTSFSCLAHHPDTSSQESVGPQVRLESVRVQRGRPAQHRALELRDCALRPNRVAECGWTVYGVGRVDRTKSNGRQSLVVNRAAFSHRKISITPCSGDDDARVCDG